MEHGRREIAPATRAPGGSAQRSEAHGIDDRRASTAGLHQLAAIANAGPRAAAQLRLNETANEVAHEVTHEVTNEVANAVAAPAQLQTRAGEVPGASGAAVRQLALPGSYQPSNADDYNPQGKTNTYRSGVGNFDRLGMSGFTAGWREGMMGVWKNKGWVQDTMNGKMVREQKDGNWVHAGGIQLDHATSVATMKDNLLSVNENAAVNAAFAQPAMKNYYHIEDGNKKHLAWPSSKTLAKKRLEAAKNKKENVTIEPTIHAARKYYHDIDNLVPLLGTDNASKGDDDSDILEVDKDTLEVEREWVDMLGWAQHGVQNKEIDDVQGAVESMNETLSDYDGDWPV